jgi:hypothetical protein
MSGWCSVLQNKLLIYLFKTIKTWGTKFKTKNNGMKSIRWYILESWKRITANVTTTVNSPTKLYMILLSMIC